MMNNINDYGKIYINDRIFAEVLIKAFANSSDKVFLASKNGKILGGKGKKLNLNELSENVMVYEEDNNLSFYFFAVTIFGCSIKELTSPILDNIYKQLLSIFPDDNININLRIVGVKSKYITKRNCEIEWNDESYR